MSGANESKVKISQKKSFYKKCTVYINDDLSIRERNIQGTIRERAKDLRYLEKNVKDGYKKMYAEGISIKMER